MTIRHLRIFQAVCEQMSITQAAYQLYMTQPAVSHVIAELEQELGFSLFDRISRRIYLTEPGKLFNEKTVQVLELYQELEQSAADLLNKAPLRIGSSITLAAYLLPEALQGFGAEPDIRVTVENAGVIQRMLERNEIEIALLEGVVPKGCFVIESLPPYELTMVCGTMHPFANRKEVSLEELTQERLLLREKGSAIRDTFDSALLLRNLSAEPVWSSANSLALLNAAAAGLGIAVLPEALAKSGVAEGSVSRIFVPNFSMTCPNQLVYHKDRFQSKLFCRFLSAVKETAERKGQPSEGCVPSLTTER